MAVFRQTKNKEVNMNTTTKVLLMAAVFLFGTVATAWAQNDDPVTVTFRVNTSTVSDTLNGGVLQIRGNVNGEEQTDYFGQVVDWSAGSHQGTHVAGDYWEIDFQMAPGDVLTYKFWVGHDIDTPAQNGGEQGWEFNNPDPDMNDYVFEMPEDATEDFATEVLYFNRVAPFEPSGEEEVAVHFRVNVGNQVATGQYDPENEEHVVGVRGEVAEDGSFLYKFVVDRGESILWEGSVGTGPDGNRQSGAVQADTTLRWVFFDNTPPPLGEIIEASLTFNANVGLLEELGFFNRGLGDRVAYPGTYNDWSTEEEMTFNEAANVWTASRDLTREVGSNVPFKYFIRWDESRFDESSSNYIENLDPDNGWEEPGSFGGGDRIYTFTDQEVQIVSGDFGGDVGFFNSLPAQAVISEDGVGAPTLPVTFQVDMTDALDAEEAFDPANDELFILLETPIFALTQGLRTGAEALDIPAQREALRLEATGDNMYELTLELVLPTENHIGFVIAYEQPDGTLVTNGGGFDAGRRYYRYVTPDAVVGDDVLWPTSYTLDMITWKQEDLDFPEPPDYGLGERPVLFNVGTNDLDWGATNVVLAPESDADSGNIFYSGTMYLPLEGTNIDEPVTGDTPRAITLSQNYPNPFNPTTNINFTLPESQNVRLDVFNILGQRVATLVDGHRTAGQHTVQFDASRLSSGVYLYRLQAGSFVTQKSMMLVK